MRVLLLQRQVPEIVDTAPSGVVTVHLTCSPMVTASVKRAASVFGPLRKSHRMLKAGVHCMPVRRVMKYCDHEACGAS